VPGLDSVSYLTNESIMQLNIVPEHLLVLGGGYIGSNLADVPALWQSGHHSAPWPAIVSREDPEVAVELQKALESRRPRVFVERGSKRIEKKNGKIAISWESSGRAVSVSGSHILIATGRRPQHR